MASAIRIAIDCMGGDFGLRSSIPAAVLALSTYPDLELTLVGDHRAIAARLPAAGLARLNIAHAPDTVTMADKPSAALRHKRQSSMRIAIDLLKAARVDAVVSAGNTGALMAMGCYVLKTLPGISRPAICSAIPTRAGHCYLLDLGANVDSSAEQLQQFAVMGAALSTALDGNKNPRVALLNIGTEDIKGNEQVKSAATLITDMSAINYVGFVEASAVFSSDLDVIVCDGFVGNVFLKACEGTAAYINQTMREQFTYNLLSRLSALAAAPVLKRIYQKLNPEQYNGASFLGLQGVLVKSHGDSSPQGFASAIGAARAEVASKMLAAINKHLLASDLAAPQ